MAWDPNQYLRFDEKRFRPGLELLSRIPLQRAATIYDIGCGTGALTDALRQRWPEATVTGIDSSPDMLAKAGADFPDMAWIEADAATWRPESPPDLLYSNAALHWVADHASLFPRLFASLAPGGVLAVQMPGNFDAPSHRLLTETAADGPWSDRLAALATTARVLPQERYYDLLAGDAASLDFWETTYLQVMAGKDPVLEWVRGTALRPYLDALDDSDRPVFEAAYAERLRAAYPERLDGHTLFPFRRFFMIAVKAA
ncbi:MAG: trans-aconitate 2-methyltransferase [Minwuiales bacterium]|nr:trans-aconitate 2-methyltransferase [Minwuiales bacterium]